MKEREEFKFIVIYLKGDSSVCYTVTAEYFKHEDNAISFYKNLRKIASVPLDSCIFREDLSELSFDQTYQ